ncbi:unnamed protein product [Callosobruchus maculatus]|uniref:Fe2OG dioxygenase domain-containing protein n=1 Tax=Callosobruchus maculatus TaxID=64391 RepID=A0A653CE83_CALMS|nr:unnamed protein product [Callosobruchus maculatus]
MTNSVSLKQRGVQKTKSEKKQSVDKNDPEEKPHFKYGPMPTFQGQHIWARGVFIVGALVYVWFNYNKPVETVMAKYKEIYDMKGYMLECDDEYKKDVSQYPGCIPKFCGRFVSDKIVTAVEADILLKFAKKVMAMGGSSGGATVMDLNSGALSYNDKFINAYIKDEKLLIPSDRTIFKLVRSKIQNAIAQTFKLDVDSIHVTQPLFFSRLTALEAKIPNDEYWHPHIDKDTYESFHYTSLIYLNDYGMDFDGGRFVFMDNMEKSLKNITVEPRKGRVLMFSAGAENPHHVERVTSGQRYAMTVPFTCDSSKVINNPQLL